MNGSFTILLICIKHICDIINVIPVNEKIFHSEKKKQHKLIVHYSELSKVMHYFPSVFDHTFKNPFSIKIFVFYSSISGQTRKVTCICTGGVPIAHPYAFLYFLLGTSPLPGKKKKIHQDTGHTFLFDQQFLCPLKILFGSSPGIIFTLPVVSFIQ